MKKKKIEQQKSLTAKERKELRRANDPSYDKSVKKDEVILDNDAEFEVDVDDEALVADEPVKKGFKAFFKKDNALFVAIASVGAFFAVALIIIGSMFYPVFYPLIRYRDIDNPVAVIRLSTGERIELVILEDQVPNASTMFIYLARIGFFDGVIIHDTTNNYVRFGQHTNPDALNSFQYMRSRDTSFTNRIEDITPPENAMGSSKFDFRMQDSRENHDSNNAAATHVNKFDQEGWISLVYSLSGVDFQINAVTGSQHTIPPINPGPQAQTKNLLARPFGHTFDERSTEVVQRIAKLPKIEDAARHNFWRMPNNNPDPHTQSNIQAIRIRDIRIHNLDYWGKWRTFNWDNYFQPADAIHRVNWHGGNPIN